MKIFRKIVDFYIDGSIHVALSCFCFVRISQLHFNISKDFVMAYFAFFGTLVGYNFVKYVPLFSEKRIKIRLKLKTILAMSLLSFVAVGYYFFQLHRMVQLCAFVFLMLTLLYTLPFFPNRKNARNWAGVKIYIVSLCWVGVTIVLPVLNDDVLVSSDFYLQCLQRFILIFVLILIFEIIDLAKDDPHLQTVPQQIGVKPTKILGCVLLLILCMLEIFVQNSRFPSQSLLIEFFIAIVIVLFLAFANETRSKYYTSFWVESVPIFWWLLWILLQ